MGEVPLIRKLSDSFLSDWVKAMGVLSCWPLFLIFLAISAINQTVRRCNPIIRLYVEEVDDKISRVQLASESFWFTKATRAILDTFRSWHWTGVLVKAHWVGVIFVTFYVGVGKIVNVFLSWLNGWLSANVGSLGVLILIFAAIGLFMFLLPPVPGVPVYLAGGVIIVNRLIDPEQGHQWNFWVACIFTAGVCFGIKCFAIISQQKGIGEKFSGNVTVKKLVGVNSLTIRAIRKILMKPGISLGKVCILCGGPDWPTSVLTGILRLNLGQMLIGSAPCFLLILPRVTA